MALAKPVDLLEMSGWFPTYEQEAAAPNLMAKLTLLMGRRQRPVRCNPGCCVIDQQLTGFSGSAIAGVRAPNVGS